VRWRGAHRETGLKHKYGDMKETRVKFERGDDGQLTMKGNMFSLNIVSEVVARKIGPGPPDMYSDALVSALWQLYKPELEDHHSDPEHDNDRENLRLISDLRRDLARNPRDAPEMKNTQPYSNQY